MGKTEALDSISLPDWAVMYVCQSPLEVDYKRCLKDIAAAFTAYSLFIPSERRVSTCMISMCRGERIS